MTPSQEVDYILPDCFFAVGQVIGTTKQFEPAAVAWLHDRYRQKFLHAITQLGNSWAKDRQRVTAVGRYLGQRLLHHSEGRPLIDLEAIERATRDVETGCQMNAQREAFESKSRAARAPDDTPIELRH